MPETMSGLRELLRKVDSKTDDFLRNRLDTGPEAGAFKEDGRFNLGGLVAILSVGARDRARVVPEGLDLSALDSRLIETALSRLNSPVTLEEAKEILDLLRTGVVASDVVTALQVMVTKARRLPPDLFVDLLRLPDLPAEIVNAVSADLAGTASQQPRDVLTRLRDGIDRPILPKTLGVVLNRAAPKDIAETLRALIGPENRTVRLAILIYARAQGVDIDEEDLDALYQAIDPANPDLAPLLNRGLERLADQYRGAGQALAVLRKLAA
jgi:hypothetical protein